MQQFGDPQELFHRPVNLFVAAFIGSPTMNLVSAHCDGGRVAFAGHSLPLVGDFAGARGDVVLGLRPGSFELAGPWTDPELPRMEVEAELVEALGDEALVSFRVDAPAVQVEEVRTDEGRLLADDPGTRFVARVRGRVDVVTGERLTLAVDHRELHLFDPESGQALRDRLAQPTPARNLRVSRGGPGRASKRIRPARAGVERGEEAAERRVATPDGVGAEPRRSGAERVAVGRRELHAVGAVGDGGGGAVPGAARAAPLAPLAAAAARSSAALVKPSSAASAALTLTKSGPASRPSRSASPLTSSATRAPASRATRSSRAAASAGAPGGSEPATPDPAGARRDARGRGLERLPVLGAERRAGLVELGQRPAVGDRQADARLARALAPRRRSRPPPPARPPPSARRGRRAARSRGRRRRARARRGRR